MTLDGEQFKGPDLKPAKRVKNPKAMKQVHEQGCWCVLNCGEKGSVHHVLARSQGGDDVSANMVCLCGSGTTGHHGKVEANDTPTLVLLGEHLLLERPDTISYIKGKLGEAEGAAWLARRLFVQP
jgi:hypothetical protein